jgi:hypothetical protein
MTIAEITVFSFIGIGVVVFIALIIWAIFYHDDDDFPGMW